MTTVEPVLVSESTREPVAISAVKSHLMVFNAFNASMFARACPALEKEIFRFIDDCTKNAITATLTMTSVNKVITSAEPTGRNLHRKLRKGVDLGVNIFIHCNHNAITCKSSTQYTHILLRLLLKPIFIAILASAFIVDSFLFAP